VAIIVGSTVNLLYFQINLASATNAIVANDPATVWSALSFALLQIVIMFVVAIGGVFAEYALRIRMRGVYTNNLLGRWLAGNKFYELERLGGIDHPEQRIQEDIYVYAQLFITLAPTLLSTVMNVFLYSGTLWSLSAPVSLESIGLPFTIQGYLPFLAIGLGLVMTLVVHFVGIPLTKAEITRQRLEAHFRNDMAGVRENAEAVAFEKGGGIENARLREVFDLIRQNWRRFTFAQARLQAVIGLPPVLLIIAPMALCAPLIMAGKMGIGDMQLVSSSFMMVYSSVSVIASSYSDVAILRSAVARMRVFDEALSQPSQSGIEVANGQQASITTQDLHLRFPDDRSMLRVGKIELARGDRLLIRGRSGAGKSTLLRALAGLWPYGSGAVALPHDARVCFLPQRSYMPDGTLSALLSYPNAPDPARETEYRSVLQSLELDALIPRLHHHEQWRRKLSPGEQQRVAAARALLSRPDFLFLDEATSALDPRSETNLYTLLDEQLPSAAIISIAHRPDVARFHRDVLEIENGSASIGTLPPQKVTA
jgi:putative ATP-binding cassette transporter